MGTFKSYNFVLSGLKYKQISVFLNLFSCKHYAIECFEFSINNILNLWSLAIQMQLCKWALEKYYFTTDKLLLNTLCAALLYFEKENTKEIISMLWKNLTKTRILWKAYSMFTWSTKYFLILVFLDFKLVQVLTYLMLLQMKTL